MIVEHAVLRVETDQSVFFVKDMQLARALIEVSPGFIDIEVRPMIESKDAVTDTFLLLVRWNDVASHRDGFRKSERYQEWRVLLHRYYNPMPQVNYFGENIFDV